MDALDLKRQFHRSKNLTLVFSQLLAGRESRVEIASVSGLDRAAVTRATTQLIELGLVSETTNRSESGTGRPRIQLALAGHRYWVVALHIGIGSVAATSVGIDGTIGPRAFYHHRRNAEEVLAVSRLAIADVCATRSESPLGVGVIAGSWIASEEAKVPHSYDPGWQRLPFREKLANSVKLPVVLWPMALGHAQANLLFGLVPPTETFGHLYIGSIVEYALAYHGKVWWNRNGAGGILENMPIPTIDRHYDTVQNLISDEGLVEQARELALIDPSDDFETVLTLAQSEHANSKALQDLLDLRAKHTGRLITQLQEVVPLPTIVLSFSITRQLRGLELVTEELEKTCKRTRAPKIVHGGEITRSTQLAASATFLHWLLTDTAG